jgi:hypothetical protein
LGRVGAIEGDESGDIFLAFSTANVGADEGNSAQPPFTDQNATIQRMQSWKMDAMFTAVVQATEESVINTLVAARTMVGKRFPQDTQMRSIWLPAIQAQLGLDNKNPTTALTALQAASPIEFGSIGFLNNASCLYHVYIRGEAYLAAGQGKAAAAEFQKIIDHSSIVWNCWTGALARLGVGRANALQARTSQGADAAAARVRALAAYQDFLALWKDADPDIPILNEAKAEYAKLH